LAIKQARQIFQRMKAYIQYRIALCLHLEIYLVTSMIIINETIRSDLIVFIALFADLATVAVAYDNAHSEARPVEWQLPKIWIISVILGVELALATWVIRGTLYVPNGGIVQNWGNVQEVLFLEVALTENWLIFVTRGGKTFPSWQLIGAIGGVDAFATIFCIFGWLSGSIYQKPLPDPNSQWWFKQNGNGHTDVVTAVVIWAYSIGVIIVIAITYWCLNQIPSLNDLGRKNRSVHDTQMENIIGHLSKLALKHEKDEHGDSRWTLVTKSTDEDDED
jgi:H+-transporting ATPase